MRSMKRKPTLLLAFAACAVLMLGVAAPARATASGDRNRDGIPDWWEVRWRLSLGVNQARLDQDRDGLNNLFEYRSRNCPRLADTDRDRRLDSWEDPDRDKLTNRAESVVWTRPLDADSDDDGIRDAKEDPDRDLLGNVFELADHTNPFDSDTDNDGKSDGLENPDRDSLNNKQESVVWTHGLIKDTDRDGTQDGDEDFDHDGFDNDDEYVAGTDPTDPDSDDDGVEDGDELAGTVVSFNRETGILVIQPFCEYTGGGETPGDVPAPDGELGTRVSKCEPPEEIPPIEVAVKIVDDTLFEWEDAEESVEPPTVENLLPGTVLSRVDTVLPEGYETLHAVKIVFAGAEDWGENDPDMEIH